MYKDQKTYSTRYTGNWVISSIDDFFYNHRDIGGYNLKAQVIYQNLENKKFIKENHDINLLFNKVVGLIVDESDKVVKYNYESIGEPLIFDVPDNALGVKSQKIYNLLGYENPRDFNEVKGLFEESVLNKKNIHSSFIYSNAHKIPAGQNNGLVDFYLIPSYEILRFFFLKGSELTKELFGYFLSKDEKINREFNQLYLKNGESILNINDSKTAFLFVKEGLSESEIECLFRTAYIENAYNCINLLKESFLINSQKMYYAVRTIIPQDFSFKIMVTGSSFEWCGVKYFIVNEIHDTMENFPYDKIEFLPFFDHRRNNRERSSINNETQKRIASLASKNARIIQDQSGNKDEAVLIDILHPSKFSFKEKSKIEIKKLDKKPEQSSYGSSILDYLEKNEISLEEGIGKNDEIARGRSNNSNSKIERENGIRRDIFLEAINKLQIGKVSYFDTTYPSNFKDKPIIINQKISINLFYNLIICEVSKLNKNSNEMEYSYIIRADNDSSDCSRYAILRSSLSSKIEAGKMFILYREVFSKLGVNVDKNKMNDYFKINLKYNAYNQSDKTSVELRDKINKELEDVFKITI